MKKLYFWLRNTFGFSKTESNGFVVLIPLMFLCVTAPTIYKYYAVNRTVNTFHMNAADSLVAVLEQRIKIEEDKSKGDRQFRYKGKRRIDGQNKNQLVGTSEPKAYHDREESPVRRAYKNKNSIQSFDINLADTATLKKIYGIGPVLSERIIKYRDLLGGFTNEQQLQDVYGLEGEALRKLREACYIAPDFIPKQLAVNEIKSYQLDDHPYISKKAALAIDSYRFQHGNIKNIETLYQLHAIDSATIQKIYPYLKF